MDVSNRININGDNTVEDSFTGSSNTVTQLSTSSSNVRMEQSISLDGKNKVSSSFNAGSAADLAQAESSPAEQQYKSNGVRSAPECNLSEPIELINEDHCIREQLLTEKLRQLLNKPLCVITVSGETAQPKAKLVTFFYQRLQGFTLSGNAADVSETQNVQTDSIKKAGGAARGLLMWGPFIHKLADGNEGAVVLLETGLPTRHDTFEDLEKISCSLTLGSRLSSVHYLVLERSIENDSATWKGLKDFHTRNSDARDGHKLFQEACCICPEEPEPRMPTATEEPVANCTHLVLEEIFVKVNGYELHQPDSMDTELAQIVAERLKPECLTVKQDMGRQVTGQGFIDLFRSYFQDIEISESPQMQRHNAPNCAGTIAIEGVSVASSNKITDSTVSNAFNATGSGMASQYAVLKDVNIQQSSQFVNATVTNAMSNSGGSDGGGPASIHLENVNISANTLMSENITGIPSDNRQRTQLQDSRIMSAMHQSDHISLRFPPAQLSLDDNHQDCTIYLNLMETGESPVQGPETTTCINLPKAEYKTKINRQDLSITAKNVISGSQLVYYQSPNKVGSIFKMVVALGQKKQALVEVDASNFNLVVKVNDRILFSSKSAQRDDIFMQLPGGDYMMIFNHSEFSLLVENELNPQVPLFLYYKKHVILQIPGTKLQLALNFKLFKIALTDITQAVGVDSEIDGMMKSVRNERSRLSKTTLRAQDDTDYEICINQPKAALIVRDAQEAKRMRFDYNWEQHTSEFMQDRSNSTPNS